ncbi:MAG: phage head-tail connector protein [Gemmataceae bacterium]|jgi:hypothetical protein|nr:phage head-tail connector protein [Gemmataceae bacterium]
MSLDTLANVKLRIGVTTTADDTLLTHLLSTASAQIQSICNRSFLGGTFTEYFDGNETIFQLSNWPIVSVSSVKVDPTRNFPSETLVPTDRYVVYLERGTIECVGGRLLLPNKAPLVNQDRLTAPNYPRTVQVVYSASATVPEEIKQAVARLVSYWYQKVKTEVSSSHQMLSQQRYGDVFLTFRNSAELRIPVDVLALISPFRAPVI